MKHKITPDLWMDYCGRKLDAFVAWKPQWKVTRLTKIIAYMPAHVVLCMAALIGAFGIYIFSKVARLVKYIWSGTEEGKQ